MAKTINIGQLSDEVMDILNSYETTIEDKMTEELDSLAKEGVRKLKDASPGDDYAKKWTKRIDGKHTRHPTAVLYNKKYPLTHLLENGHVKVLWGTRTNDFVGAREHIAPVNEWIQSKFENDIRIIISGGL